MARDKYHHKRSSGKGNNEDLLAFAGLDADPHASRADLVFMSLEVHENEKDQRKRH